MLFHLKREAATGHSFFLTVLVSLRGVAWAIHSIIILLITFLEDLKETYLFNPSNFSHPSLEVVMYLFLSLKGWQSSILWSVLCRFHSLHHCCHSLSFISICCHVFSLVVSLAVTLCHSLYNSLSLVVIRCHSLSFVVTRCTTRLSFYKWSRKSEEDIAIKFYKSYEGQKQSFADVLQNKCS